MQCKFHSRHVKSSFLNGGTVLLNVSCYVIIWEKLTKREAPEGYTKHKHTHAKMPDPKTTNTTMPTTLVLSHCYPSSCDCSAIHEASAVCKFLNRTTSRVKRNCLYFRPRRELPIHIPQIQVSGGGEGVSFLEWFQKFRKIAVPYSSRVQTVASSQDRCEDPSNLALRNRCEILGLSPRFISELRPSEGRFADDVSGKRIGCNF